MTQVDDDELPEHDLSFEELIHLYLNTTIPADADLIDLYDVLLIDLDSQANLTMALGFQNPDDMELTISSMMHKAVKEEQIDSAEGILTTAEGIDLMPSNVQLSGLELSLINEYGREVVLKQYIDEVRLNYDFILIDCAPSLSVLTVNALVASDSVLIPTQPQYFSMAGIQMFYETFCKIRKKMNPSLSIEGVLVTMMIIMIRFFINLVKRDLLFPNDRVFYTVHRVKDSFIGVLPCIEANHILFQ